MTVDIVAEECRAFLGNHAKTSIREKARLDESLEAVAYTENKSSAIKKSMDRIRNLLVVQNIGNELTTSVRLVTCRESTADHKNMALVDILLHLCNRSEDILLSKVAEYAHTDLRTGIAPSLCRIVVAVCSREYRKICNWSLNRLALISEIGLLCLEWLHALKTSRDYILAICLCCVRIYLSKLGRVGSHEIEEVELHTIDCKFAVLAICNFSDKNGIRIIEFTFGLNKNRTVAIIEEFLLIDIDLRIKTVTERHLADCLCYTTEAKSITGNDVLCLDLLVNICPVSLELLNVRHIVVEWSMLDEIQLITLELQFRRNHLLGIHSRDTERHKHRRYVDVLEGSAHRVLSTD